MDEHPTGQPAPTGDATQSQLPTGTWERGERTTVGWWHCTSCAANGFTAQYPEDFAQWHAASTGHTTHVHHRDNQTYYGHLPAEPQADPSDHR